MITELASYLQIGNLRFIKQNQKIKVEPRWIEYMSQMWAKANYREEYLPENLIEIMKKSRANYRPKPNQNSSRNPIEDFLLDDDNDLPF